MKLLYFSEKKKEKINILSDKRKQQLLAIQQEQG